MCQISDSRVFPSGRRHTAKKPASRRTKSRPSRCVHHRSPKRGVGHRGTAYGVKPTRRIRSVKRAFPRKGSGRGWILSLIIQLERSEPPVPAIPAPDRFPPDRHRARLVHNMRCNAALRVPRASGVHLAPRRDGPRPRKHGLKPRHHSVRHLTTPAPSGILRWPRDTSGSLHTSEIEN